MAPASDDRGNERTGGGEEAEPEAKTDGWLNTYADMVTLLLTFFVLMVALSSTDTAKMEMFMLALSRDGITAEQFWEIQDRYDFEAREYDSWDEAFPYPGEGGVIIEDRGGQAALQELHDAMQEYIEQEQLGQVIAASLTGDFLTITLASDILFRSGSAEITEEMSHSAGVIARMINATFVSDDPFEIVVSGHTDTVPINTYQYPSNWHLSMDRAKNFLWELLNNTNEIEPGLFSARGFGEFRPIASNATPEGMQANRRVEVMISLARYNPMQQEQPHQFPQQPTSPD